MESVKCEYGVAHHKRAFDLHSEKPLDEEKSKILEELAYGLTLHG